MPNKFKYIPILTEHEIKRFHAAIKKKNIEECWPWIFKLSNDRYGKFSIRGSLYLAHRIAFYLENKIDPGPELVCHTCDNPPCCNPRHLILGSSYRNIIDSVNKGRHSSVILEGERRPNSKLTNLQVKEIRWKRLLGFTYMDLGKEYNVHWSTIRLVCTTTWDHIK